MNFYQVSQLRSDATPYVEFLRTKDLSAGLYRLEAGAEDKQSPHGEEEMYYVVAGRARFSSGDKDIEIEAGDILFVPAMEQHRFQDIEEDLELIVFFAPPEGVR